VTHLAPQLADLRLDRPLFPIAGSIGKYELQGVLARCGGTSGMVYLATDTERHINVALKVIRREADDANLSALTREREGAELQQYLATQTDVTPAVYECIEDDRMLCIAMDYVQGDDLDRSVGNGRSLPLIEAVRIARDLCAGLAVMHRPVRDRLGKWSTIVHGDVTPANIRLTPRGHVKLLDYGTATKLKLPRTHARSACLTPEYSPPERLKTGIVTARGDLWAVGILLYEALTGHRPHAHCGTPLAPSATLASLPRSCPTTLVELLGMCLAPRQIDRYLTAEDLRRDLELVLIGWQPRLARR
jgi:eukaryotic-like serine/threonine-protein kinase